MTIWLSKSDLDKATTVLLYGLRIPRPDWVTPEVDEYVVEYAIKPAFVRALLEIDTIAYAAGFPEHLKPAGTE